MNYDKAHELVRQIMETEEYRKYQEAKKTAHENDLNVALLKEFKSLERLAQSQIFSGKPVDELTNQQLKKIGETLQFNKEAADFLLAEYNFNKIISDIYRIIAEGVGIQINFGND